MLLLTIFVKLLDPKHTSESHSLLPLVYVNNGHAYTNGNALQSHPNLIKFQNPYKLITISCTNANATTQNNMTINMNHKVSNHFALCKQIYPKNL